MMVGLMAAVVMLALPVARTDDQREVSLRVHPPEEFLLPAPVLDQLADGDVLRVYLNSGVPGSRGTVHQCVGRAGGFSGCGNDFPVQFDDNGNAAFQYQLEDSGTCGVTGSCALVINNYDGGVAYAYTVFGAVATPEPVITLSPSGPYSPGDDVRVEVAALAPGTPVSAAFCSPRCGAFTTAVAGEDGRAALTVAIQGRCSRCGIAVLAGVRESLVRVQHASPPTPTYSSIRLAVGLSAAAALLLAAWWIITHTEWRPPSEAATPELEQATL